MMTGRILAREDQLKFLLSAFTKCTALPGAILVWGPSASGKSMVVEAAVKLGKIEHLAFVSGREMVCGLGQFLGTIVKQLFEKCDVNLDDIKCDSLLEFCNILCKLKVDAKVRSEKFVVVVEDIENLRNGNGEVIQVLSRLQDYVQFNICTLFISTLPFNSYCSLFDTKPMVVVYFPQYTKDEIISILMKYAPAGCDQDLYSFYVKMTASVFYVACRDIRKLQRLTLLNFERFIRPLREESTPVSQKKKMELWTKLQPKLMLDFRTLKANIVPANDLNDASSRIMKEMKNKNIHRFPRCVKYLLVSSYLATYNPPSSDKRFFVKSFLGKKRRRINEEFESEKPQDAQMISLPRILAIYDFLTDHSIPFNQLMLGQMTHLCELELLESSVSSISPLDEPKFKCLASFEFVDSVAKSLEIDIKKYLYQYV